MWKKFKRHASDEASSSSKLPFPSPSSLPRTPSRESNRLSPGTSPEATESDSQTPFSSFSFPSPPTSLPDRTVGQERPTDPLGLSVIYQPNKIPSIDIIFVHGLGGTSRNTWSRNKNPDLFWPHKWLPIEPEITTARVLSFGYNANFRSRGPPSLEGISDFAKDLLYGMKFGKDDAMNELCIGTRPIVFVVHSMGGLVVKKAYLLGQNDDIYKSIVSSISAILFLATPHRGTDLAEALNRILSISVFRYTPKQYINDLKRNSPALEELNDQFRNVAPRLQIFSFYETRPTSIGSKNILILSKDTSILGYPGEISKSLDADHHNVCKYVSRQDSNYVSVRDALNTLVSRFRAAGAALLNSKNIQDMKKVEALLAVSEKPEDDYLFFHDRWMPGTCEWILLQPSFNEWLRESSGSSVLWVHALPASGKSVLSSFIIDHLTDVGTVCEYYYFRFGDHAKRSLTSCLRVLAFQVAQHVPAFCEALNRLNDAGFTLEKADSRTIWQKLFVSILFKINFATNIYWIIDALDESDTPKVLIEMLSNLSSSKVPIKVLIISRRSPDLTLSFERLRKHIHVESLPIQDGYRDIRMFVEKEMEFMRASKELKTEVVQKLLAKSNSNFLWVHLAINEILQCHTEEDVQFALEALPMGITSLYERMEASITKGAKPSSLKLAKVILIWATCPRRPISLEELSQALQPEFRPMLDLGHTISQVCGHFIVVDSATRLTMVHQTARDYLIRDESHPFSVSPDSSHEMLFKKCLEFLDIQLRQRKGSPNEAQPFLQYAATSWAFHLRRTPVTSGSTLSLLVRFLSRASVLNWISNLARISELKSMVLASQAMNDFVQRKRKLDKLESPLLHRLRDLDVVEQWATDLLKMVGKFGMDLLLNPSSIYGEIPPFCPRNSMIYRQFGGKDLSSTPLVVNGRTSTTWDDNLAKIVVGRGIQGEMILCSGLRIALATSDRRVFLYDATTFEETHILAHNEHICAINFSSSADRLVTYGFKTTKVWNVATGEQLCSIQNPVEGRALHITFASGDTTLLSSSDDKLVRGANLQDPSPTWSIMDPRLLKEDASINSPCCMAFNADATQVAVAYRKLPLSVWAVEPPELISRCRRKNNSAAMHVVDQVKWHPHTGEILGLYNDGCVFKWHPSEDTHQEISAAASEITCSPEGSMFATGDMNGTIKLFNYHHFALVYQLSCESLLLDLCFSPDGKRLYDVRGDTCNVWEPNALIRLNDHDDRASDDAASEGGSLPISSLISEVSAEIRSPITALSVHPSGQCWAIGNDDGVVYVSSASQTAVVELWSSSSFMTIEHLHWGMNGTHIACVELGGTVTVKRVESSQSVWNATTLFRVKIDIKFGGIQQILLSPDCGSVLVVSQSSATLWSIESSSIEAAIETQAHVRFVSHPTDTTLLLGFNSKSFTTYSWRTLVALDNMLIEYPPKSLLGEFNLQRSLSSEFHTEPAKNGHAIRRLVSTPSSSYVLVLNSRITASASRETHLSILDYPTNNTALEAVSQITVPQSIISTIEETLGVLPNHGLIFLDRNRRICSWRLHSGDGTDAVKRHFFLPKDWANVESLQLCTLLRNGTLLCPNNGEVAAISSELNSEW